MGTFSKPIRQLVNSAKAKVDRATLPTKLASYDHVVVDGSVMLHEVYERHPELAYQIASRSGAGKLERESGG
jgi:hypothetical protein